MPLLNPDLPTAIVQLVLLLGTAALILGVVRHEILTRRTDRHEARLEQLRRRYHRDGAL